MKDVFLKQKEEKYIFKIDNKFLVGHRLRVYYN